MTLTTLRDEPDRLDAVADILCAAVIADEYVAAQELEVVRTRLEKLLGLEVLPEAVRARMEGFDRKAFDLAHAVGRLGLEADEDREELLAAALDVVVADRFVDTSEYGFIAELAERLGLPVPSQLR